METDLDVLLERFRDVAMGKRVSRPAQTFRRYAISNFRGGIGKSTLAFNLAWEVSRKYDTLLLDACPQANFSQSLLGEITAQDDIPTIYDALLPMVMPGTTEIHADDLLTSVPPHCDGFKRGRKVYMIRGSKELFLFPSLLYAQLSAAATLGERAQNTTKNILESLGAVIERARKSVDFDKVLMDTSPFFGGATHLAWVAAEALIVPVRVDQHSIEALRLTLSMLTDNKMDFLRLNQQAGIDNSPKIHAIAMTHCGWNRQAQFTPDRSTQAYLGQALDIVKEHAELFSSSNPVECIHILDDFHSAGRISGSKRMPLSTLVVGSQHTIEGQRLQVNQSLDRYTKQVKSLAATL